MKKTHTTKTHLGCALLVGMLIAGAGYTARAQSQETLMDQQAKISETIQKHQEMLSEGETWQRDGKNQVAEGQRELEIAQKERAALEAKIDRELPKIEKRKKTKDKEAVKAAEADLQELRREYRDDVKRIQTNMDEATKKIRAGQQMEDKGSERVKLVSGNLRAAEEQKKEIDRKLSESSKSGSTTNSAPKEKKERKPRK